MKSLFQLPLTRGLAEVERKEKLYYSYWIQKERLNVFPDRSGMHANQKLYTLLFKTIQMITYILKCILFG